MAFFNANVDTLLRNDLDHAYEDMAFGGNYAAIIGVFRKEAVSGDAKKVPLKRDLGAGQGATAATAYANASLAGRDAFIVTPYKNYGFTIIPLDQNAFTSGDDNSVADLLLDESATAMDSCKMQFDQALGGDGSGTVATITANAAGPVLTFATMTEVNRLTVGATYVSKDVPFGAALDAGSITCTAVNPGTKKATFTANGGWTATNTHVIGLQGTMAASTSPVVWPGIPGWIPPAASRPVTGSFFGVTRSTSESKLAGLYLDGTALGVLEGINQLAYMIADIPGAKPDLCVLSYKTLGRINAQLQTQGRYREGSMKGAGIDVFYKTVVVNGPTGDMNLLPSSNWPENLVAVLDKSTWVCGSPNNKPFVPASASGNPIVEVPGDDTAVAKYRTQAIIWCEAPGRNGMLTIKP
jgi:hypothetical protein